MHELRNTLKKCVLEHLIFSVALLLVNVWCAGGVVLVFYTHVVASDPPAELTR